MSLFTAAAAAFDSGRIYSFEQAFGVRDITTAAMQAAIQDWIKLYYQAEATKEEDPCQRIPATIVSKLTKTTFSEYQAAPTKAKGTEYIREILDALEKQRKKAMQQALIGGSCFLKPIFGQNSLTFAVIPRTAYIPLGRNEREEVTDIGTAERTISGSSYFTLLERRTVDAAGRLTIRNKLYMSDTKDTLGLEVRLSSLDKYAQLLPEYTYPEPVWSLGLIPVDVPMENCVDGSADPVAVFAPAAQLIHNINRNEAQLNGEFERGQSRIFVPSIMLKRDAKTGRRGLRDSVFVATPMLEVEKITIFSPDLREASYHARRTEYLRSVENIIGLKRGLLSEVEAQERTAKEITSSEGDYNLTIIDLQEMWEKAVREAVRICDLMGRMYRVYSGPQIDPVKDVAISWGNGILYDEDQRWIDLKGMVAANMLKAEFAVGWYFDMPTETEADLQKIREKYMPQIEEMLE